MIPRRRGKRPQKGNPHKLTREQHVIPVATLRRFALPDGRVEVHLRDQRIVTLPLDHQLFCVDRLWDQTSEAGYMKRIEDEFQSVVDLLETGRLSSLSPAEHRCITRFWALWHWRNHYRLSLGRPETQWDYGEGLSQDKEEILESNGYIFAIEEGTIPARMMTGLRIRMGIDFYDMANGGKRWGVLRSPALPLLIGDRPGSLMSIPASPRLLLAADNPDGELTLAETFNANKMALSLSRDFAVIGRS